MARETRLNLSEGAVSEYATTPKTGIARISRGHLRRIPINIPVEIKLPDTTLAAQTHDISPGGLRLVSEARLQPGTPLQLHCSFGKICYLKISGQIVYCQSLRLESFTGQTIGIKFSGVRDWEEKILASAIHELNETPETRDKSSLVILVSKDNLALEAADLYRHSKDPSGPPWPSAKGLVALRSVSPESVDYAAIDTLSQQHRQLQRALSPSPWDLPTYTLLINGEELDTHRYEYFVFREKLITDYRHTVPILKQLKAGKLPDNYRQYIFGRYCVGNKETNRAALEAAYAASKEFKLFPLSRRVQIAMDLHARLIANKEKLIELMVIEGHPRRLAEWEFSGMEQAYQKPSLDFYCRNLTKKIPSPRGETLYWQRKPDGVVCVSPPRNAPCSSSLIAGFALLAGNALVIKPPLRCPISTLFLWKEVVHEALKAHGAPPGTLNVVVGNSDDILEEWLSSEYVDDILFIGESKTGLSVGVRAFQNGKKPILELSGNDMMFIWKDADLDGAVQSLLDGFLGSTQICMVPKKAFVHEDIYEEFERRFVAGTRRLKLGLPSDPEVSLSPVLKISEFYEFLEDALSNGAELLCGGTRVNHHGIPSERGQFITPAAIRVKETATAQRMRCIREENFFPLIPLIRVSAVTSSRNRSTRDMAIFRQMMAAANGNDYGLRVSAWVRSKFYSKKFIEQVQNSGLLRINCRHVGFSPLLATHGGTRKSGGPFGELNYVWQKTSHLQGISVAKSPRAE